MVLLYFVSQQKFRSNQREILTNSVVQEIIHSWMDLRKDIFRCEGVFEILKSMLNYEQVKRPNFIEIENKFEAICKNHNSHLSLSKIMDKSPIKAKHISFFEKKRPSFALDEAKPSSKTLKPKKIGTFSIQSRHLNFTK